MKFIEFSINKSEIIDKVSLNTAYMGAKTEGEPGHFNRIATVNEDNRLLTEFWENMCGALSDRLREFIYQSEMNEDALKLTLEVSGAYDDNMTSSLTDDLRGAVAAGVTSRWCAFTAPGKAPEWEESCRGLLERAITKLCHRKRPLRPVDR